MPLRPAMPSADNKGRSRSWFPILAWLLTLVGLLYSIWGLEWVSAWKALKNYSPVPLLASALLTVVVVIANGVRKKSLFGSVVPLALAIKAAFICFGANNIFPAKAGEVIHTIYLSNKLNLPVAELLHVPLWERFADANMLLVLLMLLFSSLQGAWSWLPLWGAAIFLAVLWVSAFIAATQPALIPRLILIIPWVQARSFLERFQQAFQGSFKISWLLRLLAGTIVVWFVSIFFYVFSFLYLAELSLSVHQAILASIIILGINLIPSSPGSLGVFEAGVVLGLSTFGVDKATALSIGLVCHIVVFSIPLAGALIFMGRATKLSPNIPVLKE